MKKLIAIISAVLSIAATVTAKDFQTGYFLKGYNYAYRLNPALTPNHSFVGIPVIGNASISTGSNVGMNAFVQPLDGSLVTFLHPDISAENALSKFNKGANKLQTDFNFNILSLGLKTGRFYQTVDINARSMSTASIPYELFSFLKDEYSSSSHFIGKLSASTSNFVELAYGISFNVAGIVKVGARVKGLVGLANMDLSMKNLEISLDEERWVVRGNGSLTMAIDGIKAVTKADNSLDLSKTIDNIESIKSPSGYGIALDLGAQVTIIPEYLKVSASITDFGGIGWSNKINAVSSGTSWSYTGATNIPLGDDGSISIGDELSGAFDDFTDIISLTPEEEVSSFEMLPATFRAAGELKFMPFMTAGLLATVRTGTFGWSELRASLNADYKVISGSVSAAYNTFGFALGAAANLNLRYVSLFLGTDALYLGKLTPQGAPVNKLNMHVTTGINIQF
ncbi:MAG: hypothetical protein IK143_00450 [Bacteroidales bacterium]|nr:hypothetical protein [Bacteroidales bacterium]